MLFNKYPLHRSGHGFSLVEIMIATVVGMLGILVIMQVFLVAEGQKRTTTGGADAQENALMALFTMERDLRTSGLGVVGLGCTTINAYNANATPATYSFNAWPVTIARNTTRDAAGNLVSAAGTDMITLVYSTSAYGNIPTTITSPMPDSSVVLNVNNGDGFYQGELVIISEPPKPCTIVQASQDGQKTGTDWNLQHNPGGAYVYNPPGGANIFPAPAECTSTGPNPTCGYGTGARLTNMGSMVNHEYYVDGNNLMMRDVNSAAAAVALVNGIIAIRAQYGRDTTSPPDGYVDVYDNNDTTPISAAPLTKVVVAIRLAVVARSGQLEKVAVSPATLVLWNGGTIANGGELALDATAQRYRYKIYQTIIPLRNVIWNN